MKLFLAKKKKNFWSWDYSAQVPDYQDFWINRHQIKRILLYLVFSVFTYTQTFLTSSSISPCSKQLLWLEAHL